MLNHHHTAQWMNPKIVHEKPELYPIPIQSPWYHLGMDFVHGQLPFCSLHAVKVLLISVSNLYIHEANVYYTIYIYCHIAYTHYRYIPVVYMTIYHS